ncbi:uncharacterized protein LOC134792841 [Cydia splendana]|uniref:uncharacterized protein LOC134792841 n=1 Tax=Cydia splendana TaxID=1100963 RepID=UPI0021398935
MKVFLIVGFIACLIVLSVQEDSEPVVAVAGHSAELPCNVTAKRRDDELLVVAWYRDGSNTAFTSYDRRGKSKRLAAEAERYQMIVAEDEHRLVIPDVSPADAGAYQCSVEFARSPSTTTDVLLHVIEPPQRMWVGLQKNGSKIASATAGANISGNIGPYYIGDSLELFCVAFGGNPQASVFWWSGKRFIHNKTVVLSPQRVRSDITYAPLRREDHGLVLTCLANNNDVTPPLAIDIVIDMHLPPELIAVRALGANDSRVHSEDTVVLQCRVLGARPTPTVIWRARGTTLINPTQDITEEPSQRLLISEIELSIDHTWDEARVTCCVPAYKTDAELTCAPSLPLSVFYPPVLNITVEYGGQLDATNCTLHVLKGSNVTLNCTSQANPAVHQLTWFHQDDIISNYTDNNEGSFHPVLNLYEVTQKDGGAYVCGAINSEGSSYSEPVFIDLIYPAFCEEETVAEYGLGVDESINITCNVKSNPPPFQYGWAVVNGQAKADDFENKIPLNIVITDNNTYLYTRPNDTAFSSIFCWGINEVPENDLPKTPCSFLITDQTAPRPPLNCVAVKHDRDVTVTCDKGHDGGLPQKFTIVAKSTDTDEVLETISKLEPKFLIQDLTEENFKFEIVASNDKGDSQLVEIGKDSIIDELAGEEAVQNTVANITVLSLALFGGVLLVALAACALVLCAHERGSRPTAPRDPNPPLCAYNTDETTCNDSDDSECNVRRTESFRRAMARYPSKNFDVRRTSSFHSARYLHDFAEQDIGHKHNDVLRHSPSCRVHSMQNINRRRDMDTLCDHLVTQLPPSTSTFHTMPKKMRNKLSKEISDEASVITQTSDGFSLPPPPDEFGTYRSGTKIKDMPKGPTYTTIVRKNSSKKESQRQPQYGNISSMNTVGIPTVSGQSGVYTYPDDDGRQVLLRTPGVLTTFQTFPRPKESGL